MTAKPPLRPISWVTDAPARSRRRPASIKNCSSRIVAGEAQRRLGRCESGAARRSSRCSQITAFVSRRINDVASTRRSDRRRSTSRSIRHVGETRADLRARIALHMYIVTIRRPIGLAELSRTVTIASVFIPLNPGTRSIGNDGLAVADLDGVLENRCRPVDVFEPVARWRGGEQVRAEFRIQV